MFATFVLGKKCLFTRFRLCIALSDDEPDSADDEDEAALEGLVQLSPR